MSYFLPLTQRQQRERPNDSLDKDQSICGAGIIQTAYP